MADITKWEYLTFAALDPTIECGPDGGFTAPGLCARLNELGADGWEVINEILVLPNNGPVRQEYRVLLLKRPAH
jgi:hypothetical protein